MRYIVEVMTPKELEDTARKYMQALARIEKQLETTTRQTDAAFLEEIYNNIKTDLDYILGFVNINKRLTATPEESE